VVSRAHPEVFGRETRNLVARFARTNIPHFSPYHPLHIFDVPSLAEQNTATNGMNELAAVCSRTGSFLRLVGKIERLIHSCVDDRIMCQHNPTPDRTIRVTFCTLEHCTHDISKPEPHLVYVPLQDGPSQPVSCRAIGGRTIQSILNRVDRSSESVLSGRPLNGYSCL
jgi:hypothetical protein